MAPYKTLRTSSDQGRTFSTKGTEGENVKKIITTPKYITIPELRKPAQVTDRLRRDYDDLVQFERSSMKNGVRKILNSSNVIKAIYDYWGKPVTSPSSDSDDDLVSNYAQ